MKSEYFTYKSIKEVGGNNDVQVGYDTVYVRTKELRDAKKPHYKRPLYFIINVENSKNIIRKVKGRRWKNLNEGEVVLDYGSIMDLGDTAKKSNNLQIKPALGLKNELRYLRENPKEDVRIAYRFFKYGFWLAIISIIIGLASLFVSLKL